MTTSQFVNLYEVLQIGQTASADEIRKAITAQRRQWIKRQGSADPDRRAEAESRVRDIDRAEKVLLDTRTRAAFDRELADYRPPERPTDRGGGIDWLDRARAYLDQDNPSAANYAAREAINLRGDHDAAWFLRAHSSFLLGNAGDAEYEFAEAIRLAPQNPSYHYGLGEAYAAMGKWDRAMRKYEDALRIDPGNPEYRTSIAQVFLQNEMAAKALEIMESVVREHPDNPAFLYYLAIALHDELLDHLGKIGPLVLHGQVLNEGGFYILSEEQASLVMKRADNIDNLKTGDPDIAKMVEELRQMVHEAREPKWNWTNWHKWFLALLIFGIVPFVGGVGGGGAGAVFMGFLMIIAIGGLFYVLRHKPMWQHRLKAATEFGRVERKGR
ncbi:tetratricopeptide repeat protein [Lentzea sp. HUAS12]|uniref:J domain-containing protein n=1 Tax=Lentzea sp. HUAS12 TaxID=2951806 RepID=UPI0020A1195A|nr:tetratricopeptide repeat protein [Lentzea sp. HUAS12]USX53017.1 tetratricopeptide repeat protein [Lentzea sp. HUAS12]